MAVHPEVLSQFSRAVIDRRFADARACLAPWLKDELDEAALEATLDRTLATAAEQSGIESPRWPTEFSLDDNEIDLAELKRDTPTFPAAITEKNYRGWHCLQFDPDTDDNAPFDVWVATVVDDNGDVRLGHLEFMGAD
jgi:hypothetical protein